MATFPLSAILAGTPTLDDEDTLDGTYIDDADPAMPVAEPRKPLDVSKGAPTGGNIDALKEAFAQARQNRLGAELGMAGETIQRAFAPKTQSTGYWQRMLQGADRPVQEMQAQQKLEADRDAAATAKLGKELYAKQVAAQAEKLQREAELQKVKLDPNSQFNVAGRARWRALNPELAEQMGAHFETATLTDLGDPVKIREMLVRQKQDEADAAFRRDKLEADVSEGKANRESREAEGQKNRENRLEAERIAQAGRDAARAASVDRAETAFQRKIQEGLFSVEEKTQMLDVNLQQLYDMVERYGPSEMLGPQGKQMRLFLGEIATDRAKLMDPTSAAMLGEVEREAANLWDPNTNAARFNLAKKSALALLKTMQANNRKRAEIAYQVRGMQAPQRGATVGAPKAPPPSPAAAPTAPEAGGAVRIDPDTGERRQWNGKEWVVLSG